MPSIEAVWYGGAPAPWYWRAASGLFGAIAGLRRWSYTSGLFSIQSLDVPVIVVGNITAGGTGKTPLVIHVTEVLQQAGYQPGVVSRGYAGTHRGAVLEVGSDTDPAVAGDEPVLIAARTGLPVAVGRDRAAAAAYLVERLGADVVVSDDGLQHYAMDRDVEICVVDGARRFGNGRLMPAGPLREPVERLHSVDFVVSNDSGRDGEVEMQLAMDDARRLKDHELRPLARFRSTPVHAVAGIGNPSRYFAALEARGLTVIRHPLPDHHWYRPGELDFGDDLPVLMTEKDAVKCWALAPPHAWFVPVTASLPASFDQDLLEVVARAAG